MKRPLLLLLILYVLISGFSGKKGRETNIAVKWPPPLYTVNLQEAQEKINLGRLLFYDPVLSADSSVSCANCHSPYNAFAHTDHALSHGIYDSIGSRNAPALMNLAWQSSYMWDGMIPHLEMQSLFPITHPGEMGETFPHVITKLQQIPSYKLWYAKAWNDTTITGEQTLKSLSAFMLTLISNNSKYDSVMRSQAAFTRQEMKGYRLFQRNCASCHQEPLFSNFSFKYNGLPVDKKLNDTGRMKVTGFVSDSLLFKVPSLRNIEYTYPYMHDGRFKRLAEVLNHYTEIKNSSQLSHELRRKIRMTADEKTELISFLLTLSDRSFIFNRNHSYPHELIRQTANTER